MNYQYDIIKLLFCIAWVTIVIPVVSLFGYFLYLSEPSAGWHYAILFSIALVILHSPWFVYKGYEAIRSIYRDYKFSRDIRAVTRW